MALEAAQDGRPDGRVVIVTGASSGLGRATAIEFANMGCKVICADIRPDAPSGETVTTHDFIYKTSSGQAHFVRTDVTESSEVEALIQEAIKTYGRLDVIVNNAGISLESKLGAKSIEDTEDTTFDLTMRVNTRSVFLGSKYAIRQFLAQDSHPSGSRGWIVNISSIYGLVGASGHGGTLTFGKLRKALLLT